MRAFRLGIVLSLLLIASCVETPSVAVDSGVPLDAERPACADEPGPARAVFVLPREGSERFFDLPWPTDVRRTSTGTVDLTGFPNPRNNEFVGRYVTAIRARLRGFATHGAVYFRFSRAIDEGSLPSDASASLEPGATVALIDVDPDSPTRGTRHPIVIRSQRCATQYWSAHSVALRPVYGLPLAGDRTYAAVITRGVRARDQSAFERDADFAALLEGGGDASVERVRAIYADALPAIEAAGIARADILSLAVFTTQDATSETIAIRDWMIENYPAPTVRTARVVSETPGFTEVTGTYGPVPIFQAGELPYQLEGGAIEVDGAGVPIVHDEYDARFTIAIPSSPMPAGGYPVLLYAHGTGGDHESVARGALMRSIIGLGYAAIGIDQIHHGARNPTTLDPSLLFFNVGNPDAGRDNNRQSALDVVQQARLISGFRIATDVVQRGVGEVRLNPERIFFMGHSQGGLNGPIFLAIDDHARGGVISAGSTVIAPALIDKLDPLPIGALVVALLGLPGSEWQDAFAREGFTYEHPIATVLQSWIEAADAANYAPMIFARPRTGPNGAVFAPKSVLMTEGLLDITSPPIAIEALAGSIGVPLVEPVHAPVLALSLQNTGVFAPPVTANVADGRATAGLLQFPRGDHFVIYEDATAGAQVRGFLGSFLTSELPTIPAP